MHITFTGVTGSNITVNAPQQFPTGGIIMWSGAEGAIPSGWVLCNGTNSTPDLRGKFVVGYHNSDSDYDVNDTGGNKQQTLSVNQIPAHSHDAGTLNADNDTHDHDYAFAQGSGGTIGNNYQSTGIANVTNRGNQAELDQSGSPDGQRLASFTADTGDHQHDHNVSGNTGNRGGGGSHENRPPFYALCYIMKT